MKKIYILSIFLFAGVVTFAQETTAFSYPEDSKGEPGEKMRHGDNHDRATPFWEEDFAGGLPSTWAIIDSSGICPWVYTTDGSWGYFSDNGENQGDPAMNSTTAGNGYLICDNDSANHVTYGQPSGANYDYLSSWFVTEAIDCGSHNSVILRFEQSFRYNNSVALEVRVSNDSVNWTTYDVSGGIPNNTASADPDEITLNISSIAANENTVYLAFGWSARVYYWSIDDISLSEADPNDVSLESGYWESGNYGIQQWKIPLGQASPLQFRAGLNNVTAATMTDAYFTVNVDNTSGSVFTETSNFISIPSAETDTADAATTWTPTEIDTHDIVFNAAVDGQTDGNLDNNMLSESLVITDFVYGMDNLDANNNGVTGTIGNWSNNGGMNFGIGNFYEVLATDKIVQIQIGVSSTSTNQDQPIYGEVYRFDGNNYDLLGNTLDYNITASDLGSVVTLDFPNPIDVTTGDLLVVVAAHYGSTDDVRFWMAQQVPQGIVRGYDASFQWYSLINPEAVVVRAVFENPFADVAEISDGTAISIFPNPTQSNATVSLTLLNDEEIGLEVIDMNGKVLINKALGNLNEGKHDVQLDLTGFASGMYTVKIKVNDHFEYKKLIID
jgi:hypothetical protein